MILVKAIILPICFIKIICQNIIGFYQQYDVYSDQYSWTRCNENCYTCIGSYNSVNDNQNCLSCDPNKGKYFLEGDVKQNCYTKDQLPSGKSFFLDVKQNPHKWVECHSLCGSCSKRPVNKNTNTLIQMNCDSCKDNNYIKVNTNCYLKQNSDNGIGFSIDSDIKYCGDLTDDRTGKQLGISSDELECIIKPDNYYFINNHFGKHLKKCPSKCEICEGISGNEDDVKCIKCSNNFVMRANSNDCECPPIYGDDGDGNCVNCKHLPSKSFNLNGACISSKEGYKIIDTTYNILSKCERPCLDCENVGEISRCKSCRSNYYLDPKAQRNSTINNNNEICLTYDECLYLGFPEKDFNWCIICSEISENHYKFPSSLKCEQINSPNLNEFYEKKDGYNSYGACYYRCAECNLSPKGENQQNCISCKSPFVQDQTITSNCIEVTTQPNVESEDECKDKLFKIKQSDGEKQKDCINEGQFCNQDNPFLLQRFGLCINLCPVIDINTINLDQNDIPIITIPVTEESGYSYFKNILNNECVHFFDDHSYIKNFWLKLNTIIEQQGLAIFNGNLRLLSNNNEHYIFGEDSTFHITTLSNQNSFIYLNNIKNNNFEYNFDLNYFKDIYYFNGVNKYKNLRNERRISIIYLGECEKIIRNLQINSLYGNTLLMKLDLYRPIKDDEIVTNKLKYKIYDSSDPSNMVDLSICEDNYPINILNPVSFNTDENSEIYKLVITLRNVLKEGYEPFILHSNFYTETCMQFSNEHDVDMTLKDRKTYIYEKIKNFKLCEKDCYYKSTDIKINFINCVCKVQQAQDELEEGDDSAKDSDFNSLDDNNQNYYFNEKISKKLEEISNNKINDYFNFYLIKCYKLYFSSNGFYYNYVSWIILGLFGLYILLMFFYFCIGFDVYINQLKKFLFLKYLGREEALKKLNIKREINKDNKEDSSIDFSNESNKDIPSINLNNKVQNRINNDNIYNREKNYAIKNRNEWIRENKASMLAHPLKDDQIKVVNDYDYINNDLYKNKDIINTDLHNQKQTNNDDNDYPAPPKRKDNKNNKYYFMEKNNDLINARTIKPITDKNYDIVQTLLKGKQKENKESENNVISSIEELNDEDKKDKQMKTFNKKSIEHNTFPAIYIYDLILEGDNETIIEQDIKSEDSKIITKREYSFLNDGEINELDFDNSFAHDKRKFMRIYFSFIKYNLLIYFSFLTYEDFNTSFAKMALFTNYLILYLTFCTFFFNNNSIHNIYENEGKYKIGYHFLRVLGAFVLSLIFIKLIKLWITFYRRRSLKMKLMKRYTDSKNEILRMIETYNTYMKIYFAISIIIIIFFCYYVSVVGAVYRYSQKYLIVNWIVCIAFHFVFSLVLNFIPTILRYLSLKENNDSKRSMYNASKILSYFL